MFFKLDVQAQTVDENRIYAMKEAYGTFGSTILSGVTIGNGAVVAAEQWQRKM